MQFIVLNSANVKLSLEKMQSAKMNSGCRCN